MDTSHLAPHERAYYAVVKSEFRLKPTGHQDVWQDRHGQFHNVPSPIGKNEAQVQRDLERLRAKFSQLPDDD